YKAPLICDVARGWRSCSETSRSSRRDSAWEPDKMVEPMEIDSEHEHVEPEIGFEDCITFDPMEIDSDDMATWSMTLTSETSAFSNLPAGSARPEHSLTRKNSTNKVSSQHKDGDRKARGWPGASTAPNSKQRAPPHHQRRRPRRLLEEVPERKLARVDFLSRTLIGHKPLDSFAENYEKTMPDWLLLLRKPFTSQRSKARTTGAQAS
ncbi:hypothetical protein FALBO_10902, partial [Fusarium albosuccineum]